MISPIDRDEVSARYRAAPLGDKSPADLKLVFGTRMFRAFAFAFDAAPAAPWPRLRAWSGPARPSRFSEEIMPDG